MLLKCKADGIKQTPYSNPKLPFASGEGARPKLSPRVSLLSPRLFNSTMNSALCQNSNQNPVNLPSFSGSEHYKKGMSVLKFGLMRLDALRANYQKMLYYSLFVVL